MLLTEGLIQFQEAGAGILPAPWGWPSGQKETLRDRDKAAATLSIIHPLGGQQHSGVQQPPMGSGTLG